MLLRAYSFYIFLGSVISLFCAVRGHSGLLQYIFEAPGGYNMHFRSEMCSKEESRRIMETYLSLVDAVHHKTRAYQALLAGNFYLFN